MATINKPRCKNCGGTEFTRDINTPASDLACVECGTVSEENPIVSEVSFGETASGAATVQGAFVGSDQARANFGNNRGSLDSREQTLNKGKRRIKTVAAVLGIADYISDAAYLWFRLALTNNFVQGRRSQNVVAACLYIACRKVKTHHMLIDFSSRLQISVYSVGATFLKMVKTLHISNLPLADPSLFIQHFAEQLNFGNSKIKVIKDAVKLAHRMADDWIHEGRRPAGIAGACLMLAARMNNFRRTHLEIAAVAKIGESTIQKRLNEFKNTNASKLSIDEFRKATNIESTAPPSYTSNRIKEKAIQQMINHNNKYSEEKETVMNFILKDSEISSEEIRTYILKIQKQQREDLKRKVNQVVPPSLGEEGEIRRSIDEDEDDDYGSEGDSEKDDNAANSIYDSFERQQENQARLIELNRPKNLHKLPTTGDLLGKIKSDPENLEDVDDEELEGFLLTEDESRIKERVWVGLNHDFLIEQEKRRLKEESDKLAGHTTIKRRRKKNIDDDGLGIPKTELTEFASGLDPAALGLQSSINSIGEGSSALSSAKSMLQKKSYSKKLNYAAVENLF
ncbi:BA75_02787T0 [Komagataella pastoris]|uniref:Transcription factor IIIB 70 kDa subunit n=1 Tax=Komagataella pastoris TaxID=4922 RepID=A0A1B2JCU3_PICPA|nr:BA75_02787T0 [Komagataella pastoris]